MEAAFIEPMQCMPVAALPPRGARNGLSRFKFDGYRCLAVKRAERSRRFFLAKKKVINRRFSPPAILHVVVPRALATTVHILPSKLARFGIVRSTSFSRSRVILEVFALEVGWVDLKLTPGLESLAGPGAFCPAHRTEASMW